MKIDIRRKLLYFTLLILAVDGLISYAMYESNKKLHDSEQWVQHTERVINQSGKVILLANEVEIAWRNFVLTNDSTLLVPLYTADKKLFRDIAELKQLTSDNPMQQDRIDSLERSMHNRLETIYTRIGLRRKEGLMPTIANILIKQVGHHTDSISQTIKRIRQEEEILMVRRKSSNKQSIKTFDEVSVLRLLGRELFALLLIVVTGKYWLQNKEKEQRAAELVIANKELVFQIGEKAKRADELLLINERISESEHSYREMIYTSTALICVLRGSGHIVSMANGAMLDKWGKASNDVIGKPIISLLDNNIKNIFEKLLDNVYSTGETYVGYETPVTVQRNGSPYLSYYNFSYQAQHNLEGNVEGVMVVAYEVTTEAKLNQKIRESEKQYRELSIILEDKVIHRTAELNTTNGQLENMNKELQSFAYIASHDLQEPLRKIKTFSERILKSEYNNLTEKGRDQFERIQGASGRMQVLIEDLLAYSNTGTQGIQFVKTDIYRLIEETREDFHDELRQKNATIEGAGKCEVEVVPFQIRQILNNLIGNSLKFARPGLATHIMIGCAINLGSAFGIEGLSGKTSYFHLSVADNGIGFEQENSLDIFKLFRRLHGRSEYDGTGIGLAIVKKIVENHHGLITANGVLNKGASFNIYLPVI